jgi:hypothetical protein
VQSFAEVPNEYAQYKSLDLEKYRRPWERLQVDSGISASTWHQGFVDAITSPDSGESGRPL